MKQFKRQLAPESQVVATAISARGLHTEKNQDAYLILEKQGVFAVCDGMGGRAGGDVASQLLIQTIRDTLKTAPVDTISVGYLIALINYANHTVYLHAKQNLELRGMGTTLVLAWIAGAQLHVYHAGDSRAYRLRENHLKCLTRDHTVNSGKKLSRVLGVRKYIAVEHNHWEWRPTDRLLLVSDGISHVLPDLQLTQLLVETPEPIVTQTAQLITSARKAGGKDDKTAILIESSS
ncbi:MAG: protein phosphatase 2C domain-containing protein [Methylococcales bacterium]